MANYRITVRYDGTKYKGWQKLSNCNETIQGKLIGVISRLIGYEVDVIGSGRTDAGVHALGQVANFHLREEVEDLDEFLLKINQYLPEDIAITNIKKVDERFHARYSAKSKTYRYRLHLSPISNVFERKYVYDCSDMSLDADKIRQAADKLIGTHDFKAFCANKHMKKSTIRTIYDIGIIENEYGIDIDYSADGFLQNMVRILTGTLIEVGNNKIAVNDIDQILDKCNRENAGFTAPPQGLCLIEVKY